MAKENESLDGNQQDWSWLSTDQKIDSKNISQKIAEILQYTQEDFDTTAIEGAMAHDIRERNVRVPENSSYQELGEPSPNSDEANKLIEAKILRDLSLLVVKHYKHEKELIVAKDNLEKTKSNEGKLQKAATDAENNYVADSGSYVASTAYEKANQSLRDNIEAQGKYQQNVDRLKNTIEVEQKEDGLKVTDENNTLLKPTVIKAIDKPCKLKTIEPKQGEENPKKEVELTNSEKKFNDRLTSLLVHIERWIESNEHNNRAITLSSNKVPQGIQQLRNIIRQNKNANPIDKAQLIKNALQAINNKPDENFSQKFKYHFFKRNDALERQYANYCEALRILIKSSQPLPFVQVMNLKSENQFGSKVKSAQQSSLNTQRRSDAIS